MMLFNIYYYIYDIDTKFPIIYYKLIKYNYANLIKHLNYNYIFNIINIL